MELKALIIVFVVFHAYVIYLRWRLGKEKAEEEFERRSEKIKYSGIQKFFVYNWLRIYLGQTDSISRTVVKLAPKDKWLFTIFSWGMAFSFPFISPWLIPSAAFLGIMGITINYDKYWDKLHGITATMTYVSALVFLAVKFWWVGIVFSALFVIAILIMKYAWPTKDKKLPPEDQRVVRGEIKNFTYWVEVVGFELIWSGLFLFVVILAKHFA